MTGEDYGAESTDTRPVLKPPTNVFEGEIPSIDPPDDFNDEDIDDGPVAEAGKGTEDDPKKDNQEQTSSTKGEIKPLL